MEQTPQPIPMTTVRFIQPWHYSLDGFRTTRASVGEVADLPPHLVQSALDQRVAELVAGPGAPGATENKATGAVPQAEAEAAGKAAAEAANAAEAQAQAAQAAQAPAEPAPAPAPKAKAKAAPKAAK